MYHAQCRQSRLYGEKGDNEVKQGVWIDLLAFILDLKGKNTQEIVSRLRDQSSLQMGSLASK